MNWFKMAKISLQFLGYDKLGTFKVLANGNPYTFYEVDRKEDFKWIIENQPWKHGELFNKLKRGFSDPKRHKELNPPQDHTEEEKQQMISELPSQKELWGT